MGLEFDFFAGTATARSAGAALNPGNWCNGASSTDPFGHVLFTVNGRVMYRDCTVNASTNLRMVLGGSIFNVNALRTVYEFKTCPSSLFSGCSDWNASSTGAAASGLDLFAHVDSSGFVYFGDVDVTGGALLFGCSDTHRLATARTEIEMAPLYSHDYEPPSSGTLQWSNGESGAKYVDVTIINDGVVDTSLYETFSVTFSNARGAFMDSARSTVTVKIQDVDGAGILSVRPDQALIGERSLCRTRCESNYTIEQKEWVSYVTIERTGGSRGSVCADFAATDLVPNMTAVMGLHFEASRKTLCWNHDEVGNRSSYVQLTFQGSYDRLHKSFALAMSASTHADAANMSVSGESVQAHGVGFGEPTVQHIEDMDARPGTVSFVANKVTGFGVFQFSRVDDTAAMQVS